MLRKNAFLLFLLAFVLLLTACSGDKGATTEADYTITVQSEGGMSLADVRVTVYKDAQRQALLHTAVTDKEGKISFTKPQADEYFAVLSDVPNGYAVDESYAVASTDCVISLKTVITEISDISKATYKLGSVMNDFSITATDGNTYKLSELLKTKKAVMLNFWFINCGPCRSEFPYIQQAYDEYKDEIEILAINPTGDSNAEIASYASELGLTFPCAAVGSEWESCMRIYGYPTTVIIDRYGMFCMAHTGSVPDKETFTKIFGYFTADDYKQTIIKSISDIK